MEGSSNASYPGLTGIDFIYWLSASYLIGQPNWIVLRAPLAACILPCVHSQQPVTMQYLHPSPRRTQQDNETIWGKIYIYRNSQQRLHRFSWRAMADSYPSIKSQLAPCSTSSLRTSVCACVAAHSRDMNPSWPKKRRRSRERGRDDNNTTTCKVWRN